MKREIQRIAVTTAVVTEVGHLAWSAGQAVRAGMDAAGTLGAGRAVVRRLVPWDVRHARGTDTWHGG